MNSSQVSQGPPPFAPTKVVVLSELSSREKDKYYDLLLRRNAKFTYDESLKSYVGNVRLLGPSAKRSQYEEKKVTDTSLPFEDRLKRLQSGAAVSVRIQGAESFDYNEFVKIVALISTNGELVKPKQRTLTWIMRTIEELYDARFAFEKIEIEKEDPSAANTVANEAKANAVSMFPVFCLRRICTLQGLGKLVDQTCWDLLYNIHIYRTDHLEVELFARFLKEHYDYDDLLFFLYVRSVISKTLNINFRGRWACKTELAVTNSNSNSIQPSTLYISYRECVRIANIIYGSQGNEAICKRFIAMVTTQLVGQLNPETNTDSRRIDIIQFLHLAVIGYHYAQNMMNTPGGGNQGGEEEYNQDGGDIDDMMNDLQQDQDQGRYEDEYDPQEGHGDRVPEEESYQNEYGDQNQGNYSEYISGMAQEQQYLSAGDLQRRILEEEEEDRREAEIQRPGSPSESVGGQSGASNWTVSSEDFTQLQLDREKEFLEYVCEPLEGLVLEQNQYHTTEQQAHIATQIAQSIVDEIADQLRVRVNEALSVREPTSLEEFDHFLVEILQNPEMVAEMENSRDVMLAYMVDRNRHEAMGAASDDEFAAMAHNSRPNTAGSSRPTSGQQQYEEPQQQQYEEPQQQQYEEPQQQQYEEPQQQYEEPQQQYEVEPVMEDFNSMRVQEHQETPTAAPAAAPTPSLSDYSSAQYEPTPSELAYSSDNDTSSVAPVTRPLEYSESEASESRPVTTEPAPASEQNFRPSTGALHSSLPASTASSRPGTAAMAPPTASSSRPSTGIASAVAAEAEQNFRPSSAAVGSSLPVSTNNSRPATSEVAAVAAEQNFRPSSAAVGSSLPASTNNSRPATSEVAAVAAEQNFRPSSAAVGSSLPASTNNSRPATSEVAATAGVAATAVTEETTPTTATDDTTTTAGTAAHGTWQPVPSTENATAPPADTDTDADASLAWTADGQFAALQTDREEEFIELLCEPLADLTAEVKDKVKSQLAATLHDRVNSALDGFSPANLAEFDDTIVNVLQADSMVEDMETICLQLLQENQ